jgi:hypothetical protein
MSNEERREHGLFAHPVYGELERLPLASRPPDDEICITPGCDGTLCGAA